MKTFENILNSLQGNEKDIKVVVLYHGGEPLLNKKFFIMAKSLREYLPLAHFKTISNGMVLTDSNILEILASPLDAIEFSLDGTSPVESEKIRINSNTKKIINNIEKLIERNIHDNNSELTIYITTAQFIGKDQAFPVAEPKAPKWLQKIFGDKVNYKPTYAMKWPHMKINNNLYELVQDPNGEYSNTCDHVDNTITVRANGDVVPCCYDLTSKLIMGNINQKNLLEIWKSKKYRELRDSISERRYQSICSSCAVVRPPVYLVPTWRY